MRQLPHMNELHEQPGLHVYTLYAQVHKLSEIQEIIDKHGIKYPIAMDAYFEAGYDTSAGLPMMWIIDVEGKVAFAGVSGYSDALDAAMEKVKYPGLGKTAVAKELVEAARAFGEGEFAKAYKLAEAVYDDPPSDEVEEEAEYIMERIDDRMSTLSVRAETAEVEENYAVAIAAWTELARYKGLDDAEEAPERLKKLNESKEVANELAKRRELLELMCDLDVKFQSVDDADGEAVTKFRQECLAAYRKFAKENEGTYAADEAESLIEIFERLLGPDASKPAEEKKEPEKVPEKEPSKDTEKK